MMASFFAVRTQKLISMEDPFFSMTPMVRSTDAIDLWKLGFMFAAESLDPKVGVLDVSFVQRSQV